MDPEKIRFNRKLPPVIVEEVLSDASAIAPGAAIQPGRRKLEFQYTALTFLAPDKVLFRYRLEGFDHEWVDAGKRRTAYYTNLPPGSYTFRVIAAGGSACPSICRM